MPFNNQRILWPEGIITRLALVYAAVITTVAIWNRKTVIDMPVLTGDATLNLTIDAELEDGAELIINVDQDATGRDVILGTGIEGDDLTGVANDKDTILLQYNKSAGVFRVVSIFKTVDGA